MDSAAFFYDVNAPKPLESANQIYKAAFSVIGSLINCS